MKKVLIVLLLLVLPSLACTLTSELGKQSLSAQAVEVPTGTAVPTPGLIKSQVATGTPSPTPAAFTVSVDAVNLRACPGVECAVVGALRGGQIVTVLDTQDAPQGGTWSKVITQGGQTAWVNSRFLEEKQP